MLKLKLRNESERERKNPAFAHHSNNPVWNTPKQWVFIIALKESEYHALCA